MRKTAILLMMLVFVAVLAGAANARAQGFGVYEQSACAAGRGAATVASPCPDASSIFFNPAGIVLTPGTIATFGATVIGPRGNFTNSTSGVVSTLNNRYYPVPDVFVKANFAKDRVSAGVGLFAPYGLTTDWPTTSEGRFLGYKSVVQAIYIQPTVAFKIGEDVAIGAGVDITRTHLELRQRLDLSSVPVTGTPFTFGTLPLGAVPKGTDFADVDLKGTKWKAGVHVGVIAKVNKMVSVGARYMSGQTADVTNGTVTYTQVPTGRSSPLLPAPIDTLVAPQFGTGGRLSTQSATASVPLPDQFVAGVGVQATPKVLVEVDYQFVRWSKFQNLTIVQPLAGTNIVVENFQNTSGVRFGFDFAVNPTTSIRAGADFHGAAAPDITVTPNLPEASRAEVMFGVGKSFGKARVDAFYMYLHQSDRAGRTVGPASGQPGTTALNNGTFSFMSNLFGVNFSVGFGTPAPAK